MALKRLLLLQTFVGFLKIFVVHKEDVVQEKVGGVTVGGFFKELHWRATCFPLFALCKTENISPDQSPPPLPSPPSHLPLAPLERWRKVEPHTVPQSIVRYPTEKSRPPGHPPPPLDSWWPQLIKMKGPLVGRGQPMASQCSSQTKFTNVWTASERRKCSKWEMFTNKNRNRSMKLCWILMK